MLLSPQAERNWESLCSVLEDVLESQSHRQLFALELGSGTGQHIIRFAQKMPFVIWQPSDIKEDSLERFVPLRKCLPCWCVSIVMCDRKIYEHIPVKSMIYLNKWFVEVYGFLNLKWSSHTPCWQYQGIYCCNPSKDGATTCSPGCQWTMGEMGRTESQLLWRYYFH